MTVRHPHEKPHHPHLPLAALLFLFVSALGLLSVHEPSTWIHIKTGEHIVRQGALPRAEFISYTMAGRPWTTASWLADILFYWLDSRFGPVGLSAVKAVAVAAGFALLLPLNPASPVLAASVLALGAFFCWMGFTETPAAFDFLMLALLIRLLRPRGRFRWPLVGWVFLAEALWANLHGTAALLGLWLVLLKTFKALLRAERAERRGYAALVACAAAGLCANPHGPAVVPQMFSGVELSWGAWRPAAVWLDGWWLFLAGGVAACWVTLQQEFFLTMTTATVLALAFLFPELRPLAILAACPTLVLALGHWVCPRKDTPARVLRWGGAAAALLALHGMLIFLPLAGARGYGAMNLEGALHFLKSNGVCGRLFNDIETGPAAAAQGGRAVFVDTRASFYGGDFLRDAAHWPQTFKTLAEIYGFDYALLANRRAEAPAAVLDADPGWTLAYADDWALVYLRRRGANAWLVKGVAPRLALANRLWPEALDAALADPRRRADLLAELDRWIVQAPDCLQALLWKAYALGRLGLGEKAERLVLLAERRPRLKRDPELLAILGAVQQRRGRREEAEKALLRAELLARRRGDAALRAQIMARLASL